MAETPEQLWERARGALRTPPAEDRQRICGREEHRRPAAPAEPTGLPVVVLLETRAHHDFRDLPLIWRDNLATVGRERAA